MPPVFGDFDEAFFARFLVGFLPDALAAARFLDDFFAERRFATSGPLGCWSGGCYQRFALGRV